MDVQRLGSQIVGFHCSCVSMGAHPCRQARSAGPDEGPDAGSFILQV